MWIPTRLPSRSNIEFAPTWTREDSHGPTDSVFTFSNSKLRPMWTQKDPKIGKQYQIAVSDYFSRARTWLRNRSEIQNFGKAWSLQPNSDVAQRNQRRAITLAT
jgi:hypothetical protein